MGFKHRSLVLLSLLFLSACSFKFSYRYLDWIAPWYVDDYVALDDSQQALLTRELKLLKHWHRDNELLKYRDYLQQLKQLVSQQGLTIEDVKQQTRQLEQLGDSLIFEATPRLTTVLKTLSQPQLDQIYEKLKGDFKQQVEEARARSVEDWQQLRSESFQEEFERWLGHINPKQQRLIDSYVEKMPADVDLAISYYQRRMNYLRGILQTDNASLEQDLLRFLSDTESFAPENYRRHRQQRSDTITSLYVDTHSTLSKKQQQHLLTELQKWSDDFQDLIDDGKK